MHMPYPLHLGHQQRHVDSPQVARHVAVDEPPLSPQLDCLECQPECLHILHGAKDNVGHSAPVEGAHLDSEEAIWGSWGQLGAVLASQDKGCWTGADAQLVLLSWQQFQFSWGQFAAFGRTSEQPSSPRLKSEWHGHGERHL